MLLLVEELFLVEGAKYLLRYFSRPRNLRLLLVDRRLLLEADIFLPGPSLLLNFLGGFNRLKINTQILAQSSGIA